MIILTTVVSEPVKYEKDNMQQHCLALIRKYSDDACYMCDYRQPCTEAEKKGAKL